MYNSNQLSNILVDIVYTWVNHRDINWQKSYKDEISNHHIISHHTATDTARFYDRNELYYSILSVHKYAPWTNNIYIVTNCDVPKHITILNKVIVVHHEEIFLNKDDLPTFNSHAIESNLHRIKGLSEHFIYFNDDVFLCNYVDKSDFFPKPQHLNIFPSNHKILYNNKEKYLKPVDTAAINTGYILKRDMNFLPIYKLHHAPFPILKSAMEEIHNLYAIESTITSSHKFRHHNDIPFATTFHAYYCLAKNIAYIAEVKARYIDISHPLFFLLTNRFSPLRRGKYKFLCLNESASIRFFSTLQNYYLKHLLDCLFL